MKTRALHILVFLLFIVDSLSSQTMSFKKYTTSDGLISNTIYDLIIDDDGYLWIATDNGVARYNGKQFKSFNYAEGLPDNEVLKLFQDRQNRVWAMCYNGEVVAIDNDSIISMIGPLELDYLGSPTIYRDGYENKQGAVFLTQYANGAYVLKGDSVTQKLKGYEINRYFEKDEETYFITRPEYGAKLNIWKAEGIILDTTVFLPSIFTVAPYGETDEALYFFTKDTAEQTVSVMKFELQSCDIEQIKFKLGQLGYVNYMSVIDNTVFLSCQQGLYEMNLNTHIAKKIHDKQFTRIVKDPQGNIWLGTLGQGLYVIETNNNLKPTKVNGHIEQLAYDSLENKILYGNTNTMCEWDLNTNNIQTTHVSETLRLYDILIDGSDLYYCFNDKIVHKNKNQIDEKPYSSKQIIKDQYSDSLILGSSFGISKCKTIASASIDQYHYNEKQKIRALALVQLAPNHLLVGSSDRLYHYIDGKYIRDSLVKTRVNAIHLDAEKNPIVISETDGVLYQTANKIYKLNKLFDIPIGTITASLYKKDTLWLATNQGIHFMTKSTGYWQTRSYPYYSNMIDHKVNDMIKIADKLYLGTHQGIHTFSPKQYQKDTFPALLKIKYISINGESKPIQKKMDLDANENNISIELEVIKFLRSDIKYFYSIDDGVSWQSSKQAELVFANLSPDNYQLRIYAQELSGVKSNEIKLDLQIAPPFYKSTSFYLLSAAALLLLIYCLYKIKIKRIKEASDIKMQLSSSQQKALRAQMNPHFLFNALNSIQQFFLEDNDLDGQEYISKFSRLVRNTLDNSEKDLQLINEELENLKRYVELEQLRLHHSFSYTAKVDPAINVLATYIPSMILQPIVENSIWHGIQHLRNTSGKIEVLIQLVSHNRLSICVSDNGVGRMKSAKINDRRSHKSQGTNLIKQRIEAINGARNLDIKIQIKNKLPLGTIVTIEIPIIDEYTYSR